MWVKLQLQRHIQSTPPTTNPVLFVPSAPERHSVDGDEHLNFGSNSSNFLKKIFIYYYLQFIIYKFFVNITNSQILCK